MIWDPVSACAFFFLLFGHSFVWSSRATCNTKNPKGETAKEPRHNTYNMVDRSSRKTSGGGRVETAIGGKKGSLVEEATPPPIRVPQSSHPKTRSSLERRTKHPRFPRTFSSIPLACFKLLPQTCKGPGCIQIVTSASNVLQGQQQRYPDVKKNKFKLDGNEYSLLLL